MDRVQQVGIDLSSTTFIDYGCGKGRALLLASHYPLRKIVGIEISAKLGQIARRNLAAYSAPDRKCTQLSVETADALEWEPPHEPTLFYFYHPFEAELLGRVLDRIYRSVVEHPRPAYVLYVGAMEEVLEQSDRLRTLAIQSEVDPRYGIYEWRRPEID
jgi:SAM-dependent methyltransferase